MVDILICSQDGCSEQSYLTLDNLCLQHYRELILQPANEEAFRAESHRLDCCIKLYQVEKALGLRPPSFELAKPLIEQSRKRIIKHNDQFVGVIEDDLEDME